MGFSCSSGKVFVLKKSSKWHFYLGDTQVISFRGHSKQFTSFVVYVHWNALTKHEILIIICHIRNGSKQALLALHFNDYKAKFISSQCLSTHQSKACFPIMEMVPFPLTDSTSPNEKKPCLRAQIMSYWWVRLIFLGTVWLLSIFWFFLEQFDFWAFFKYMCEISVTISVDLIVYIIDSSMIQPNSLPVHIFVFVYINFLL